LEKKKLTFPQKNREKITGYPAESLY